MGRYFDSKCENMLNDILCAFFKMNSICDNMYYSLAYELKCPIAAKIFHLKYAHAFPGDKFADKLSDAMIRYNLRPVRKGFEGDEHKYESICELFEKNCKEIYNLQDLIINTIGELDYEIYNKPIIIVLDEILYDLTYYCHQADIWENKSIDYKDDVSSFDDNFDDFIFLDNDDEDDD